MLQGIDISNWQKGINLKAVPSDFIIMKATQGTWYKSEDFDRQYAQAKQAGKLLGVYHYAEGSDPILEAEYFLKIVKNCVKEAILCLDWESQDNPRFGQNDKEWVKKFCDFIAKKTGVNPIVYIQASAMNRMNEIGNYGLWVAQYPNYDPTGYVETPWNEGTYSCVIRQYTSTGKLNGYNGNLDLNKFYGSKEAWLKYANPTGKKPTKTIDELVKEVMEGKWGVNPEREQRLNEAGYDAKAVQSKVNEIYEIETEAKMEIKSLETRLREKGMNAKAIMAKMKKLM